MSGLPRPFLKWAGGKRRLIDKLRKKLPKGKRLIEPFVGSGAVFMGTDYDSYLLADNNADLIDLYTILQEDGHTFIQYAESLFAARNNTPNRFYALREAFNESAPGPERAALFIYLNRHGYNGLCRYNQGGAFNVPFGKYKKPYFPGDEMRAFYRKLVERDVVLVHSSFELVMMEAVPGDVVYCDPPYVPLSDTMNFTAYTPDGFGWKEQVNLGSMVVMVSLRGVPVVVSNHSQKIINRLYRDSGAKLSFINAPRSVSCDGGKRKQAREIIATWEAAA